MATDEELTPYNRLDQRIAPPFVISTANIALVARV
jgi:hypothetical protein